MNVVVINDGSIKSIIILTVVIRPIIKFDSDTLQDCFRQAEQWMLAIP